MKKIIRFSSILLSLFSAVIFSLIIYGNNTLPDKTETFTDTITFDGIYSADVKFTNLSPAFNSDGNHLNASANIKLFGSIPVKNINVNKSQRKYVAIGGNLIGIRLRTEGVLVVGTESFDCNSGTVSPAEKAGIEIGDTLLSIDGKEIKGNDELGEIIAKSDGRALNIKLKRNESIIDTTLIPQKSTLSEIYKGGLWVRDSTGGIGTLTFADLETGAIGALGHGIYDVDTGNLMPAESGEFMSATLLGVTKGCNGTAGELRGNVGNEIYGNVNTNCENGIYGTLNYFELTDELYPVATSSEIKTGEAQIISTVSGNEKEFYDIEIEKIFTNSENKNMIIKVTDNELLDITGGIVQGMSGSPIIQNGMIIGAVTHVFLNDPTKGYGIFIENMLDITN